MSKSKITINPFQGSVAIMNIAVAEIPGAKSVLSIGRERPGVWRLFIFEAGQLTDIIESSPKRIWKIFSSEYRKLAGIARDRGRTCPYAARGLQCRNTSYNNPNGCGCFSNNEDN